MAQYDYRCEVCGKVTTIRRSMADTFDRNPYCERCMIPMSRIWKLTQFISKVKDGADQSEHHTNVLSMPMRISHQN